MWGFVSVVAAGALCVSGEGGAMEGFPHRDACDPSRLVLRVELRGIPAFGERHDVEAGG